MRPHEAGAAGIERDLRGRERANRERGELLDALASRRERVGQLAGHGDDVTRGGADPCLRVGEGLRQPLEAQAKRRRDLDRVDDAAVLRARGLQVGTAHVPSDHGAHLPFRTPARDTLLQPMSMRFEVDNAMDVIPVIDLKGGVVVRARMGRRDQYLPIETPLSPTSDPVDVARGLLDVHPFATLYVADLDAIEGRGDNRATLMRLRARFPQLVLWVDNGICDRASAQDWLDAGMGRTRARQRNAARRHARPPLRGRCPRYAFA